MAKRNIYNHVQRIEESQRASIGKFVLPGMIIRFRYSSSKSSDKRPLVLIIWKEGNKILHGLNLNYLSPSRFKELFYMLNTKYKAVEIDKTSSNTLYKDYTKISFPSVKSTLNNRVMGEEESRVQMKRMYEVYLKPKLKRDNIYRKYLMNKMNSIEVINLKSVL